MIKSGLTDSKCEIIKTWSNICFGGADYGKDSCEAEERSINGRGSLEISGQAPWLGRAGGV
mgnify:CR=1 FL=1